LSALREERHELAARQKLVHHVFARARAEATCGVEYVRQELDIADGVEEDRWSAEHPVHGDVDVVLLAERLVPGVRGLRTAVPGREADALDRLNGDPALGADGHEPLEIGGIP